MVVEIGPNLTTVFVGLVAVIPALAAAYYARRANISADTTHDLVNSRMSEMLALKDELIQAAVDAGTAAVLEADKRTATAEAATPVAVVAITGAIEAPGTPK